MYKLILPPLLQFSQMMLVYMGLAADIAEVFEAFRESKVCFSVYIQSGWSGCHTGNGKKLSSSQAQLGRATYFAVA